MPGLLESLPPKLAPPHLTKARLRLLGHALIIAALLGGFVLHAAYNLPHHAIDHDGTHYLCMAHNLVHHGTISTQRTLSPNPWLDAWRAPGYPSFLALGVVLVPGLTEQTLPGFLRAELLPLKKWQLGWLLLAAVIAGAFVWRRTGSPWPGYLSFALIAYSPALIYFINRFYSEVGAALVILFLSLTLHRAVRRPSLWAFALAGLLLAMGALTRAALMYFWLPLTIYFVLLAWRGGLPRSKVLAGLALFTLTFAIPVGAWMARNHYNFGHWILAYRGGQVLDIRANHAAMTPKEYLAAFVYYTPWVYLNPLVQESSTPGNDNWNPPKHQKLWGVDLYQATLGRVLTMDDFNHLRVQARGDTYEMKGQDTWARHTKWLGHYTVGDAHSQKVAIRKILADPWRHLLASIPLAWRGLFADVWWVTLPGFACLFYLGVSSLRRRDWPLLAFVLPAIFLFSFHSLITVNAARFNSPLVPVLAVCIGLCAHRVARRWLRKRAAKEPSDA
ncbi:MAG: hypothetical protein K9K36_12665 [Desulfarculaceae bacterium]|nr:hypothetical protein [Desulfarculaceae bacterium]MCF8048639.1 hypothetical protein [Desulfarculaceae bacterium]MCF8066091.1 hypothetical protein [Desulfarculaceae bacterium]MCF8121342.1 hypothetical protein [Desulfarculaceae bacterium]